MLFQSNLKLISQACAQNYGKIKYKSLISQIKTHTVWVINKLKACNVCYLLTEKRTVAWYFEWKTKTNTWQWLQKYYLQPQNTKYTLHGMEGVPRSFYFLSSLVLFTVGANYFLKHLKTH